MNIKFRNFRPLARPKLVLNNPSFLRDRRVEAVLFLIGFVVLMGFLGMTMGTKNLLNSIMQTAFELLTHAPHIQPAWDGCPCCGNYVF